jgi:erythromycin esterase
MIGEARIVALGEALHGFSEPLQLRNGLLQYLVEEMDFTAIALESGSVEGRRVHDYVRGGPGNPTEILTQGFGWNFGRFAANETLVKWLREINSDPTRSRKVNFYGFDLAGSLGDSSATRGPRTALLEALQYLDRVDPGAAAGCRARLADLLPNLQFDYHARRTGPAYHRLHAAERDSLTGVIADLISLIERRAARYIAASSVEDYEWARRAAAGAGQVDNWLRQVPLEWQASKEQVQLLDRASDLRDRVQADNIEWILEREGADGKVLLFAHNFHLSGQAATRSWWPLVSRPDHPDDLATLRHEVAGTYLRRRFGSTLVSIANLIGDPGVGPSDVSLPIELGADPESFDSLFSKLGVPRFALDLRTAPAAAANVLRAERQLGSQFDLPGGYRGCIQIALGMAFDIALYMDSASPASLVGNATD